MREPLPSPESDWDRVESLFESALRVEGAARERLLARASREHPRVVAEVRSLLAAHGGAGAFLERPAFALLSEPLAENSEERRIGPYRLERVLGQGGMGTVYQAVRENPTRVVALKILHHPLLADPDRLARFEREAQMLAHLQHPGIATLYETGTADGVPYIAMELVRGPTLSDWVRTRRPARETRLAVFVEICAAVEYAHGAGVLHRDLKPANVIVHEERGPGRVKVLDLGLARVREDADDGSSLTHSGALVGTLSYSSPEQVSGQLDRVGVASDVYSLGVMLYELLTGSLPYGSKGASLLEGIRTVCEEEPVRPRSHDRKLRGDLETILLKALEKEPARRYATVGALRTDVELHLAGRPIRARAPSTWYQLKKLVGRNRVLFAAAGALFLTVLAAVVALSILYVEARVAQRRAVDEAATASELNEFLRRTLSLADPGVAGRPDLSMRALLDRTAERVDRELERDTLVAGQVRITLGKAYAGLGDLALAEEHLRRAVTTLRAVLAPDDPELAYALTDLGEVVLQAGAAASAASLFEEAIAVLDEPATSEERAHAAVLRMNLARAVRAAGAADGFARAGELLEEAEELVQAFPPAEQTTLLPRLLLETASLLGAAGRSDKAEAELLRARALLEDAEELDPLALGNCLNSLGVCLGRQGRGAEAESAYRRACELFLPILGPQHPRFAAVLNNLGDQIARNGRPVEGERELRRALAIREQTLPANHPDLAVTRNHLGQALRAQGELDAAREMFERALRSNREVLGETSLEVANGEANLAQLALQAGDASAAEAHAHEALAGYRAFLPSGHWWIGALGGVLGEALLAQERFAEAETVLREAAAVVESARGADDPQTVRVRDLLARASADAQR